MLKNTKAKGTEGERFLLKKFWENGWACLRTAGSGSMSFPAPDIIAGNKLRIVAVECKITKNESKYFLKDEINQLKIFSDYFGAESWVAVKLGKNNWFFLNTEDLKDTGKNYVATLNECKYKGLLIEEFFNIDKIWKDSMNNNLSIKDDKSVLKQDI